MTEAKTCGDGLNSAFQKSAGRTCGQWLTYYDEQQTLWNADRKCLIKKMEVALSAAIEQCRKAGQEHTYWKSKMNREETALRNKVYQKQEEIHSEANWTGNAQKTMAGFMDLLLQYHKELVLGDEAPVGQAKKALEELQDNLDYFYEEWREYRELGEIS